MTGLALDFGASNTVLAAWGGQEAFRQAQREEEGRLSSVEAQPFFLPGIGRLLHLPGAGAAAEAAAVVPSVICYAGDGRRWIGTQAQEAQRRLPEAQAGAFRWMKRYILDRTPLLRRVGGVSISPAQAGSDFLAGVLTLAEAQLGGAVEELVLTTPVEAFEHYDNWLEGVSRPGQRVRVVDEPTAAALGYGVTLEPGQAYLVFDFGGGTLDVAAVLVEGGVERPHRRCRVLGKAGIELGGMNIDAWLYDEALRRCGLRENDEAVRSASQRLLLACEEVKERLSWADEARLSFADEHSPGGALDGLQLTFSRRDLEALLERRGALDRLQRALERACAAALERGYAAERFQAVLMLGGSSAIPAVQQRVRSFFGSERVRYQRPLDAVARGAAALGAGVEVLNYIQHDYAIRTLDPDSGRVHYLPLVRRGTSFPTPPAAAVLPVRATQPGQGRLWLAVFEVGGRAEDAPPQGALELTFDLSGAARLLPLSPQEAQRRQTFWLNEHNPTFLVADPPADMDAPRFQVEFRVDANRHLRVTARDLLTGRLACDDQVVVRLV